jgi:hypothetical protein
MTLIYQRLPMSLASDDQRHVPSEPTYPIALDAGRANPRVRPINEIATSDGLPCVFIVTFTAPRGQAAERKPQVIKIGTEPSLESTSILPIKNSKLALPQPPFNLL